MTSSSSRAIGWEESDMMVRVKISPQHGKGVFAAADIEAGVEILTFTGPILQRGQFKPGDYRSWLRPV